jgi:protein-disulfide isomerase
MQNPNNFFKCLSIFLIGMIIGFLISKIDIHTPAVSSQSSSGSVKVMGSENAAVTITEYSDFQCPLCRRFYTDSYSTILDNYVKNGKVKYVFKHFPLNIHPQAPDAALAAECALDQNKFWEMHDLLFQNQDQWSGQSNHNDYFKKLAADLKLDTGKFSQCLDNKKFQDNVDKDYNEGLTKNVRGTPTFYINNELIVGAQDTKVFTDTLDRLLQK